MDQNVTSIHVSLKTVQYAKKYESLKYFNQKKRITLMSGAQHFSYYTTLAVFIYTWHHSSAPRTEKYLQASEKVKLVFTSSWISSCVVEIIMCACAVTVASTWPFVTPIVTIIVTITTPGVVNTFGTVYALELTSHTCGC